MHVTVVTAVLLAVGILNAVSAQSHTEELQSLCDDIGNVSCSEGWTRVDVQHCAKYFQTPKSFDDAQEHCNSTDSVLVAFNTPEEMMKASCVTLHDNPDLDSFLIGVIRSAEKSMDDDGFDLEFDPWYPGQTDDDGGEVNCVVMNPEDWGLWKDDDCEDQQHFMCIQIM